MKSQIVLLLLLSAVPPAAYQGPPPPPPPAAETVAPAIAGVVAAGTRVIVLKDGFDGTEGPIAHPDGSLLFTETNASRIVRIDRDDNVSTFLDDTNGSNGLAFDAKGRLISVQTTPGRTRVGVIYPKGSEALLADGFEGRPNDLAVNRNGGVYFTVPSPLAAKPGTPQPAHVPVVYYIPPGGRMMKVAEGIDFPNGILLSRDERVVYINNTRGEYMLAHDVQPDGTLTNRRNFGRYEGMTKTDTGVASGADGLAIDSEGRIYAATTVGVQVFSSDGRHLGTIPSSRPMQNLAFAGPDKKTLYVVGRGGAFKIQMLSQGFGGRAK